MIGLLVLLCKKMTQELKIWSILRSLSVSNSLTFRLYESIVGHIKYISIEIIASGKRLRSLQISKKTTWQSIQDYANDQVHKSCKVQLYINRNRTKVNMSGPVLSTVFGDIVPSVCNWKQLTKLDGRTRVAYTCSYNSDGTRLASVRYDNAIHIWNVDEMSGEVGTCLKVMYIRTLCCVTYHPTKPFLASNYYKDIRIWNVDETSEQFGTYTTLAGHTNWVKSLSYSPDGTRLVSGSENGIIRIWNVDQESHSFKLNLYRCVKVLHGHMAWILSICFNPSGEYLASGSMDHTIRIWNVDETSEKFGTHMTLNGHIGWVRCVCYSPDGKYLASGSHDETIRIWNVDESSEEFGTFTTLDDHTGPVRSISYSPNGKYLASGSFANTIRIWNSNHSQSFKHNLYECVKVLRGHTNRVWSVNFHPNGKYLASTSEDKTIRIWGCP